MNILESDWSLLRSEEDIARLVNGEEDNEKHWMLSKLKYGCQPFPDGLVFLKFDVVEGTPLTDWLVNTNGDLIWSQKMRECFGEIPTIQWVPVDIVYTDGRPVEKPYYLAMILSLMPVVEVRQSVFNQFGRRLIRLKKGDVLDCAICRDAERRTLIFINDTITQKIRAAQLTGCAIHEPVNNKIEIRDF